MKPRIRGAAYEIRFADDAVLCFQYKEDAEKVMEVLPKRFAKYGLTIHPEKTRLPEFGRYAEQNAKRQGKKTATFDFLGYTPRLLASYENTPCCYRVSYILGQERVVTFEEPAAVIPHGGVCEGGESR